MSNKHVKMKSKEDTVFYYESLRKEVNRFDKEYSVKLKEMNPLAQPQHLFERTSALSQVYLAQLICAINDIDPESYFYKSDTYGMTSGPIGIANEEFTSISSLRWLYNEKYSINSLMFKRRFLTAFLTDYMVRVDDIALLKQKDSGINHSFYEYAYLNLRNIVYDAKKLILVMMSGNEYGNILIKCHQNITYSKKKIQRSLLNNNIYYGIDTIKNGLKDGSLDDDMLIYTVMRVAYMVSTNEVDLKVLPKFKYIEHATRKHDLIKLTQALGVEISNSHKFKKRPIMYKAFNNASPIIRSNYKNINDDIYLSIGLRSLFYVDFLCNDKNVHEFIFDMMTK